MVNCCICLIEIFGPLVSTNNTIENNNNNNDNNNDNDNNNNAFTSGCSCICLDCLKSFLKSQINEGKVNKDGNIRCYCPSYYSCGHEIHQEVILKILEEEKINQSLFNVSEAELLIEKFHRFHQNAVITSNPSLLWCITVDCTGVARRIEGKRNRAICDKCKTKFCTICKESHSSHSFCPTSTFSSLSLSLPLSSNSTQDKSKSSILSVEEWKSSNGGKCRKCPKCRHYIEKNGGCNHMTCSFCRHEFCWLCKSPYIGGCKGGKLCKVIAFNKNYRWGKSNITRGVTKSLTYPIITGVVCAGVGIGIGIGVGVATVGAVTILPYYGIKSIYQKFKSPSHRDSYIDEIYHENYDFDNIDLGRNSFDFDDRFVPTLSSRSTITERHQVINQVEGYREDVYKRFIQLKKYQFTNDMIFHMFTRNDDYRMSPEVFQEYVNLYQMSLEDTKFDIY